MQGIWEGFLVLIYIFHVTDLDVISQEGRRFERDFKIQCNPSCERILKILRREDLEKRES